MNEYLYGLILKSSNNYPYQYVCYSSNALNIYTFLPNVDNADAECWIECVVGDNQSGNLIFCFSYVIFTDCNGIIVVVRVASQGNV